MNNKSKSVSVIGGTLAAFLSYHKWHSIGYAVLHFLFGWIYVIYHIFAYGFPKLP